MKVHKDYRGEHDLEMRIEELTKRVKDLKDINEAVKKCLEKSEEGIVYKSKQAGCKVDWGTALMTSCCREWS